MNWTTWLRSLAAVAIGGAATGAANALATGHVNGNVGVTAGVGALATVIAYLMRSPLGPATPQDVFPPATGSIPTNGPAAASASGEPGSAR